jgi:hypothetical protein
MVSSPDPVHTIPATLNRHNSSNSIDNADSEYDLEKTRTWSEDSSQSHHHERHSVFEDVTIPANILRYANVAKQWTPDAEVTGGDDRRQARLSSNFNVVDIALEQHAALDRVLSNVSAYQAHRSSRTKSVWDHGQTINWRKPSLPTPAEEKEDELSGRQRRMTSGMQATRKISRRSTEVRQGQNSESAGPQLENTILFRSLDRYALNEADGVHLRRCSSAVPPDADYLATYNGSLENDIDQPGSEDSLHAGKEEVEEPLEPSVTRRASVAIASLYQTVTRGTTNLMRMTTIRNTYENAKIRGKHLQRKKWVQVVFEYTFYLILLCFVYFVLVGRPLWKGAVWYLYWVVHTHFTVAGTWSVTIGLAIM